MKGGRALAIFLLLAFPAACALEPSALQAEQIHSDSTSLAGNLVALLMESAATSAAPHFVLQAERLLIQTDVSEPIVHAGAAIVRTEATEQTNERDVGQAAVEPLGSRDGYRVNVYARGAPPRVESKETCLDVGASGTAQILRKPLAYSRRPDIAVAVGAAERISACGPAAFVIHGDLLISVWETDLEIHADGNREEIPSGRLQPSQAPVDSRPAVSRDQEIYLWAYNATLRLPFLPGDLYLSESKLSASTVSLRHANGDLLLADAHPVRGQDVHLAGHLDVRLHGQGVARPILAEISGEVEAANVGGADLESAAIVQPAPSWWNLGYAALALALLALVVAFERPTLAFYRRRSDAATISTPPRGHRQCRGAGYWVLGLRALDARRLGKAQRMVRRAVRLFPESLEARMLQACVAFQREDYSGAFDQFSALYPQVPEGSEKAQTACMVAAAALEQAEVEAALRWMHRASRDHFATFRVEAQKSLYDPLEQDEWFATMRGLPLTGARAAPRHDPAIT